MFFYVLYCSIPSILRLESHYRKALRLIAIDEWRLGYSTCHCSNCSIRYHAVKSLHDSAMEDHNMDATMIVLPILCNRISFDKNYYSSDEISPLENKYYKIMFDNIIGYLKKRGLKGWYLVAMIHLNKGFVSYNIKPEIDNKDAFILGLTYLKVIDEHLSKKRVNAEILKHEIFMKDIGPSQYSVFICKSNHWRINPGFFIFLESLSSELSPIYPELTKECVLEDMVKVEWSAL